MEARKALLIIDMQNDNFKSDWPQFDTDGIVERINTLGEVFRQKGFPVIYIMHTANGSGEFDKNRHCPFKCVSGASKQLRKGHILVRSPKIFIN